MVNNPSSFFLQDALIPLDNNDAERSIRSFCVGKHSWHIIDSVRGASASALLYSIAESAKANQLKPYEYFTYLLKGLLKYPRENVPEEELKKLMPWLEELPDSCRKNKTRFCWTDRLFTIYENSAYWICNTLFICCRRSIVKLFQPIQKVFHIIFTFDCKWITIKI